MPPVSSKADLYGADELTSALGWPSLQAHRDKVCFGL